MKIKPFTCVRISQSEDEDRDEDSLDCNIQNKSFSRHDIPAVVQLGYGQYNVLVVKSKQEAFQAKYPPPEYQQFDNEDSLVKIHEVLGAIRRVTKIHELTVLRGKEL